MNEHPFDAFRGKLVVVTGGAGFVGSNIVKRLLEAGAHVKVLDDFYTGSEANLPKHDELEVICGSVVDFDLVRETMKGAEYVIHEAARNIIVSTKNPREDYETNIGGTLNVLLAARELNTPRVVYSSSASVYGNPRHLPINEDESINLLSPYSVSKLGGEGYCKSFYETYGTSTAVVRYSNVYGPGQDPANPYCGVVSKFFEAVLNGDAPRIHGDGEQTRDFTYVDDAVDATLMAAVSVKAEGKIYNVATGREVTINQLARIIIGLAGKDLEPEYVDRRDIDNIRRRVLSIEKIRMELRWTPTFTIERGLKRTYEWILSLTKNES
ncbi:MAG: hypothetical protein CL946_08515 [Ectothiorhodospiraceae bacterium]|nr:hypothetical protein [Ectothiorhodospiraceae bacterium]